MSTQIAFHFCEPEHVYQLVICVTMTWQNIVSLVLAGIYEVELVDESLYDWNVKLYK